MKNNRKPPAPRRRRRLVRRRRQPKLWRIVIFLAIFLAVCVGIFRALQFSYNGAENAYTHLYTAYREHKENKEKKANAPVEETKASTPAKFNKIDTVLLIGVDKSNYKTANANADTLILLNINQQTGAMTVLLIPRSTAIPIDKNDSVPISSFQQSGTARTLTAVSSLLSLRVDKYIIVDENTLKSLVNTLDGIDLYVGDDMNYDDPQSGVSIHLNKGYQRLNGDTTMQYLMYRGDDMGDLGRAKRQELFIKSFYAEKFTVNSLLAAPAIINIMDNSLYTNIDFFTLANFRNYFKIAWNNSFTVKTLPGKLSPDGSLWQPDAALINDIVNEMGASSP
ncbi:LCP family protein [Pectinatus cerevisiiphilus]|uniref:LCP family protein n=1 Tax=Pectinatus cerevisiiphilus TaxID=86956 RepID=UPI0010470D4C|nr:LCP family protein [Pectinatus cerevisiiphilus]